MSGVDISVETSPTKLSLFVSQQMQEKILNQKTKGTNNGEKEGRRSENR
jgi:hypothetical protein